MRRTCICSYADCNFAMRRGAVCRDGQFCVRDKRAGGGARSKIPCHLRDVSSRTAETFAEHPLRCGITRRSQSRTRRLLFFFFRVCGKSFRLFERISPLRNCRRLIAWRILNVALENLHRGVRKRREVMHHTSYTDVATSPSNRC